jgi:hypothetical protein
MSNKDKRFELLMTEKDYSMLKGYAAKAGLSMAQYLRRHGINSPEQMSHETLRSKGLKV